MIQDQEKPIGGLFPLLDEDIDHASPSFLEGNNLFLVNARSALFVLVEKLRPATVWLPSFLCPALITAVKLTNSAYRFYPVNEKLEISETTWINQVNSGDLVLYVDYFGLTTDSPLLQQLAHCGAWLVRDAAQALFTPSNNTSVHFSIYSPRKFLGIPDGGILKSHCEIKVSERVNLEDIQDWHSRARQALIKRSEFDKTGTENKWFDDFRRVEKTAPCGPHPMSEMSRRLLRESVDSNTIITQRRRNYSTLLQKLSHLALFADLPAKVVPLGFPIVSKHRNQIRNSLIKRKIYPPIHWDIQNHVPRVFSNSHNLSTKILTLICDQRYNQDDMERIAGIVLDVENTQNTEVKN